MGESDIISTDVYRIILMVVANCSIVNKQLSKETAMRIGYGLIYTISLIVVALKYVI